MQLQYVVEPMQEEEDKGKIIEGGTGKGSSSTKDLMTKQAPAPQGMVPAAAKFWATGPSIRLARWGPPISSRAWGKVPAIQVVPAAPAEIEEKLVWWLQEEEVVVEET